MDLTISAKSSKWVRNMVFATAAAVVATGCSTTNPYTGESQTAKATTGSVIGAIAGAAIGVASSSKSDRGKGALIGAASGAALGGGIGYYMDVQEAELRKQLQSTGISVSRDGDNIVLHMPNAITFGFDQTDLSATAKKALYNVSLVVKEYDKTMLNVYGFTDSTGADAYNLRLSQVRASEVSNQLMRDGVASNRIVTKGMGEAHPIASNNSEQGRAENRRVEIVLSPRS
ncbi:OmpA family protein [Photobacterium aphoticum]|uniref:Outer membrane lipoprotein omp16 n=2 Tax=Photobacterium aphoticum TaxID=754436 RepID=A0A090QYQ2_9GAMM|nr:OmpA family protein [Photobacterium aphoticum]PSU54758.1 glycine zipper 2TM domain-containing protein [Photobacterium aphoticum]GAL08001.1 outer membrane lipoprotein omp16 precursor [Photobacterium aphoticum]GHA61900.1 OmpA family lipoprotein [Photobacterium aphoticum]